MTSPRGAGCPDEQAFADMVRARLGYDPFDGTSTLQADVVFASTPGAFDGTLTLRRAQQAVGARHLRGESCAEIAEALAAALAMAIDPLGTGGGRAQPDARASAVPPESTSAPAPEAPPPLHLEPAPSRDPAPPESAPSPALRLRLDAALLGSVGLAPEPTLGVEVGVGLRADLFLLRVAGRFESTAGPVGASGVPIEVRYVTATLEPCVRWALLVACASFSAGMIQTQADEPSPVETATVRAGARAGLALDVDALALEASLALHVPFVHVTVGQGERDLWTTPPVAGSLRLAIGARLP